MQADHLTDLITVCEKSKLDYFRYVENGEEIVFSKNGSGQIENQNVSKNVILQMKNKEQLQEETEENMINEASQKQEAIEKDMCTIQSPYIGIVHFEIDRDKIKDSLVNKGDVVCTIEAMKLFNNVAATVTGRIIEIYVNDGDEVEYGQPLFKIKEGNDEKI